MPHMMMLLLALLGAGPVAASIDPARADRAEQLYAEALRQLRLETIENRRMAINHLEQAARLVPDEPRYQLALARAYYEAGFLSYARKRFQRIEKLAPGDFDAHMGMGQIWRRDWLKYLDPHSLELAIGHFRDAAAARPQDAEPWLQLVPLHVERDELDLAMAAAERAVIDAPGQAQARLAHAYVSYRMGRIETASRGFAAAIPRLPKLARDRFDDISPVANEADTVALHLLPAADQGAFIDDFWREHDPDYTTPENEARLEFWARVAQAYFLYFNVRREEWDLRGEVYVRYGPPERAEYNPLGQRLSISYGTVGNFPVNVLVWDYPALGMSVVLQDRLLSEHYMLPITLTHDPDPRPDPRRVGEAGGTLATRGGRGVFPTLPPGVHALPMESVIARFEGERMPRLLAQLESRGGPGDSLRATWVVVDTAQREILRGGRDLSPSACDPAELRVADFADALPPGAYTVSLSVRDRARGRAVARRAIELSEPPSGLSLSDVLISCGSPVAGGATVRPEPNPTGRVAHSDPLTAYFEIYHLAAGHDGRARFEYVYTVESVEKDERVWLQRMLAPRPKPEPISASRAESHVGSLRRQFLTVPLGTLPAGRYRLLVRVRDAVTGAAARTEAEFERLAPGAGAGEGPPGS
jgi:GWxTD domain-containing protein